MRNLPKIGDHIFVDRSVLGVKLYEHHGIYVGDDKVVHYNGLARGIVLEKSCFEEILSNVVPLDKRNIAKVEMTSLEEFTSGDILQIKKHANAPFSFFVKIFLMLKRYDKKSSFFLKFSGFLGFKSFSISAAISSGCTPNISSSALFEP